MDMEFGKFKFEYDKVNKCIHVESVLSGDIIDCIEVGYNIDFFEFNYRVKDWYKNNFSI